MENKEQQKNRRCTRCKVILPIELYVLRRNKEYNKTCNECLQKTKEWKQKQKINIIITEPITEPEPINNNRTWYYIIEVREGAPGFADDEKYVSNKFKSFAECYKSYSSFVPGRYWRNLRRIQNEQFIFENNGVVHKNQACNTQIYYISEKIEETLGITEEHFDDVIAEIVKNIQKQ